MYEALIIKELAEIKEMLEETNSKIEESNKKIMEMLNQCKGEDKIASQGNEKF